MEDKKSVVSTPAPIRGRLTEGDTGGQQQPESGQDLPFRSGSVPSADNLQPLVSRSSALIDIRLNRMNLNDPGQCTLLFFDFIDDLEMYNGVERTKLDTVLLTVGDLLPSYRADLVLNHVRLLASCTDEVSYETMRSSLPDFLSRLLMNSLFEGLNSGEDPKFTILKAKALVTRWHMLTCQLRELPARRNFRISCKLTSLPQTLENVRDLFKLGLFRRIFLDLIKKDKLKFDSEPVMGSEQSRFTDRVPLPFNCICCPSGSGKSTFAMHMCCEESLAVYLLFSRALISCPNTYAVSQPTYHPFMSISELFIHFLSMDCSVMAASTQLKIDLAIKKFAIIGLVVALVQELDRLKSLPENRNKTWLELEARLENIEFVEMNGLQAQQILTTIQSKYPVPITFYIDEVKLESWEGYDSKRLIAIRSVLRCLGIVSVFLGTDMRPSNFFKKKGPYSGVTPTDQIMSNIFNFSSRYDAPRLAESGERVGLIHNYHPHIVAFVNFLYASREFDNPWLIRLALDYLEQHPYSTPDEYFDELFSSLFQSFSERKNYSIGFLEGQLRYIMFYAWSRLTDQSNMMSRIAGRRLLPESCINGHFGQLCGDPRYPTTMPYFSLYVSTDQMRSFVDLRSTEQRRQVKNKPLPTLNFRPRAVFVPFNKAPLTGLTAFGVGPSLNPLKISSESSINVYEGIMQLQKQSLMGSSSDGSPLELMAYYSCIHGSRASGVRGTPFPVFFERFAKSLMPESTRAISASVLIENIAFWNRFSIPFLSPMGLCNWNEDLVVFLKTVYGDAISLGMMSPSLGQDPVDCVVYNVDTKGVVTLPPAQIPTGSREYLQLDSCVPRYSESRDIALCIECKQHVNPLTNSAIETVLTKKFKLEKFQNCPIFILLALRFSKNINPNHEGFSMWRLKKVQPEDAEYNASMEPAFVLQEMKTSKKRSKQMVILVDLQTLFDNDPNASIDELATIRL